MPKHKANKVVLIQLILKVNDDNVIALNYLGNEYQIKNLIEPTEKYISNNIDKFIVQLIQIHQIDPDISAANYEEILSQNLPKFITNKQLISFDILCLYPILEKYHKEYSSNNNNN